MIGYRGCYRYTKEPDLFALELRANRADFAPAAVYVRHKLTASGVRGYRIALGGFEDGMSRQVNARTKLEEPGPLIGYRRDPVSISHEGWMLEIPGDFAERRTEFRQLALQRDAVDLGDLA